jgi:RNA polymerase sigma-70 factor (ECF subfamily)
MVVRAPASQRSGGQTEERLLVEAAQKNPARFGELYELHFHRVYVFILRRVGDRDVAEELTADVFYKALANLQRFEWRGVPFSGWLFRIAANAIVDRSKRTAREVPGGDDPEEPATETDLAEVEHRARLFRLVHDLPSDQGRVLAMRFGEEKSIREIAQSLGRSEGAVKQLQCRGLQNLRTMIEAVSTQGAEGRLRTAKQDKRSGVKNG